MRPRLKMFFLSLFFFYFVQSDSRTDQCLVGHCCGVVLSEAGTMLPDAVGEPGC